MRVGKSEGGWGPIAKWFRRLADVSGVSYEGSLRVDRAKLPGHDDEPTVEVYEFGGERQEHLSWPGARGGSSSHATRQMPRRPTLGYGGRGAGDRGAASLVARCCSAAPTSSSSSSVHGPMVILPNKPPAQPPSGCLPDYPSVLGPKLGSANGGSSSSPTPGRRGARRGNAHLVAHPPEDFRQRGDVLAVEGIEEHPPDDPDVARHYARDQLTSGRRDRDRGAALVVFGGFARDQ